MKSKKYWKLFPYLNKWDLDSPKELAESMETIPRGLWRCCFLNSRVWMRSLVYFGRMGHRSWAYQGCRHMASEQSPASFWLRINFLCPASLYFKELSSLLLLLSLGTHGALGKCFLIFTWTAGLYSPWGGKALYTTQWLTPPTPHTHKETSWKC